MVAPRTRLGPYEVVAPLGAGGMGEVWRARDTRLDREVALKFLPDAVACDAARLGRFEREAKVLAALSHPGVATLYGFEAIDERPFLVMEIVEGPTLAERVQQGPLPWREAVEIARHIAEALEAAHHRGIVHRDLKPSNVKLSPDGHVKLLDFGLAKDVGPRTITSEVKFSTETSPTDVGMILGTAPYMSPEQARGEQVDHRADVWAFGCVLYEMLTGKRAFTGATPSDVIAAILEREPEWAVLPPDTPPPVRTLLRRCLTKEAFHRTHAIADARIELEEASSFTPEADRGARNAGRRRALIAIMTIVAAGVTLWVRTNRLPAGTYARMRFNIAAARGTVPSGDNDAISLAVSPDGRHIIYQAAATGGLYMRSLDRMEVRLVPGTEHGSHPFFSPDGQWVGFLAGGKMQKVALAGGSPLPIADVPNLRGASWGQNGMIVYTPQGPMAGLYRVSAEGGTPEPLTQPEGGNENSHRWPQMLPGGKAVLYTIHPTTGRVYDSRVAVLSFETGQRKVIVEGGTCGRFVPSGHIVFARAGTLFAAPFNLQDLAVTGPAIPVIDDIWMARIGPGSAQFAFSQSGVLAYMAPYQSPRQTQLFWVDRNGQATALSSAIRAFANPRLSPDGRRIVVLVDEANDETNLWLYDRDRQTWTQLTFEGNNQSPEWSPRGDRIVFGSNRGGPRNLFVMPADGGPATRLTRNIHGQFPTAWSRSDDVVLFRQQTPSGRGFAFDFWELPMTGRGTPRLFLAGQSDMRSARSSPDGRWVAYTSEESERVEVYVRARSGSRKWTVSTDGGHEPRWSATGREIFFVSGAALRRFDQDGYKIWAASVIPGPIMRPGAARLLFERSKDMFGYDVAADGNHFVVAEAQGPSPERTQIVVVPNWFDELRTKVPVPR